MNEEMLSQHREDPRPEFSRELYKRISRFDDAATRRSGVFGTFRWAPVAAAATLVLGSVLVLTSPAARAAAQDILDMFRVKRFAAVSIDPERIEQLRSGRVDMKAMLGDSVEVIKDAGEPVVVGTVHEASLRSGLALLQPTFVFNTQVQPRIFVSGEHEARYTANAERLQGLVDLLGMDDVQVPQELDGAQVDVRMRPSVTMRYEREGNWVATFVQAPSPEVDLPKGVDLARQGEIGLRITGLPAAEAKAFASKIDWNTTLLVPVPANAASFREVDVRGTTGLMIEVDNRRTQQPANGQGSESPRSILLWSEGPNVYYIGSTMHPVDVIEMANSLQNE